MTGLQTSGYDYDGQMPFDDDWSDTPHPSDTFAQGTMMTSFSVIHPELTGLSSLHDATVPVNEGELSDFQLRLRTPIGILAYRSE